MERVSSLTILFPCYNDVGTIGGLIARADRVARDVSSDYEMIVVDDGSSDGSQDLLARLRSWYPKLRIIYHEKNRGYGGALRSGFRSASKDWVFYTDGDGQYDVGEIRNLVAALGEDAGAAATGYKVARRDPVYRIWIGLCYRLLVQRLFRVPLRDLNCDFRLIRRRDLQQICLRESGGSICLELVKKLDLAGTRFVEVPVSHYPRSYGRSQFFRARNVVGTVLGLCRLWRRMAQAPGG